MIAGVSLKIEGSIGLCLVLGAWCLVLGAAWCYRFLSPISNKRRTNE